MTFTLSSLGGCNFLGCVASAASAFRDFAQGSACCNLGCRLHLKEAADGIGWLGLELHLAPGVLLKLHATESFCKTFLVFKDNCPLQPYCLFPTSFKTFCVPYVGANALFAGPGGGLVALASLLFLQEDLIHWVLIFPNGSKDLFQPCSGTLRPFCCNGPGTDWLPEYQGGPARHFFPHSLSARSLTCCLSEFSAPTF